MMRGASGDEWGKLLGQEYNRPAEAGVLKKPREATLKATGSRKTILKKSVIKYN
jgi:hypothetical protein